MPMAHQHQARAGDTIACPDTHELTACAAVAAIYNEAGDSYAAYADGDPRRPFEFSGLHAYADRQVWAVLDRKLTDMRAAGADTVRVLDAGCGPGTWLRRVVVRARALGFGRIVARGFDIAEVQVRRARALSHALAALPGIDIGFDVGNLDQPLPEGDTSVDIVLCLYSVLSHLPQPRIGPAIGELTRVTAGCFVTTVRTIGSPPTAFVGPMDEVRALARDHDGESCAIELADGRTAAFAFHMFTAAELRRLFADKLTIESLRGLDLFHSRFVPDPRWNPASAKPTHRLCAELDVLEQRYAENPEFIDRAAHLLLVAHRPNKFDDDAAVRHVSTL